MANESLARNEEVIDGTYPLGSLIRRSVGGAVYETEFGEGEGAVPAAIRIREVDPTEAENLSWRLRTVAELSHPNLLKIHSTGTSTLNGVTVFYVVMERAEESLEAVLAERALTTRETREMLAPTLEALDYLHKKGYAHSRLRPSNVLAVNDQLKLSTDSVVRVTDNAGGLVAEDMRSLGVLILQCLGQKVPNPSSAQPADERWESHDYEGVPQPLRDIVRHCLDADSSRRWTVEQVKARLAAPAPVVEISAQTEDHRDAGGAKGGMAKWIYAGLGVLLLAVVLVAVSRNHDSAPVPNPVAAATQQDSQAPAAEPAVVDPEAASPQPVVPAPRAVAPRVPLPQNANVPGDRKAAGWSVIAGAYRSRVLAEKRMRDMAKRWPNFEISVFESQGEKSPYLVLLGRNLSEEQAKELRKRAAKARLPGDTYIKRLM